MGNVNLSSISVKNGISNKKISSRSITGFIWPNDNAAYLNRTYRTTFALPESFKAIRIVLRNPSLSDVTWSGAIYVAPTGECSSVQDGLSWSRVTFNFGDTFAVIPKAKGTISKGNIVYGRVVSDWIQVSSIARTDGGMLPCVCISGYADVGISALPMSLGTGQIDAPWNNKSDSYVGGFTVDTWSGSGDVSNSTMTDGIEFSYSSPFYEIEALHDTDVSTIFGIGDSLMNGDSDPSLSMASPVHFAGVDLRSKGKKINVFNHGMSSQGTLSFLNNLESILDSKTLDVLVYHAGSPNTSLPMSREYLFNLEKDNAITASRVIGNGRVLRTIMCTILPFSQTGGAETSRVEFNSWLSNFCDRRGFIYLDTSAIVCDPVNTNQIATAYDSGDTLHLNKEGYKAIGLAISGLLELYL